MTPDEFDKLAAVEDQMWYFRALHRHLHAETRALHPGASRLKLLDAGCGTGGWLRRARHWEPRWDLRGFDASSHAVAWARQKGAGESVSQGVLENPPFDDGAFDAITCADVLYMVDDVDQALAGLARCVRVGGSLVLTAPAYRWLWGAHDESVGGKRRFVRGELEKALQRVGLTPVQSTYWNAVTFPLVVARRKIWRSDPRRGEVALGPAWIEWGLSRAMQGERAWLDSGGRWAWGGNLLLSAQKL